MPCYNTTLTSGMPTIHWLYWSFNSATKQFGQMRPQQKISDILPINLNLYA